MGNAYRYKSFGSSLSITGAESISRFRYFGAMSYDQASLQSNFVSYSHLQWDISSTIIHNFVDSNPSGFSERHLNPNATPGSSSQCDLSKGVAAKYKTTSVPIYTKGLCGAWGYWKIKWLTDETRKKLGNVEGYIIQQMLFPIGHTTTCFDQSGITRPPCEASYWEMWWINEKGEAFEGYSNLPNSPDGPDDTWTSPDYYLCSFGSKLVESYVQFHAVTRDCYMKWGFSRGPTCANGLLGGYQKPDSWKPTSINSTHRRAPATWMCCAFDIGPDCQFKIYPVCYNNRDNTFVWPDPINT